MFLSSLPFYKEFETNFQIIDKTVTRFTFKFNCSFLKGVEGCTMGDPLSVTLSGIYMVKIENIVEIHQKP